MNVNQHTKELSEIKEAKEDKDIREIKGFSIEDFVDPKLISGLLENNLSLTEKIHNDFDGNVANITYKNLISFYNPKINFKDFETTKEGILKSINKILESSEYVESDRESNYFKNISDLFALKHLLKVVERSKNAIELSITKLKQEINSDKNQKFKYNNQLKKNVNEILTDEEDLINNYRNRPRPNTAIPSKKKSLEPNNMKFLEEGTFISFAASKNMNNSNANEEINNEMNSLNEYNNKMNINLTSFIWPKSRTLLTIISKMYSEKFISAEQRGLLKEMIIDRDESLTQYLNQYEVTGDRFKLYKNIIELSNEKLKN